jgi:hypothetical protein
MKLYTTMKALYISMQLAGLLAIPGPVRADQAPSMKATKREPMDARTLLKKGEASGSMPEGMVVRIGACLGAPDVKASGDRVPEELKEMWEFTSNQVHRVVIESTLGKLVYHRVESRPFDSRGICKELLEGKAIEIQARKGKGPKVAFLGTSYQLGSRFIEVVWNGKTILDLHESCAAGLDLYRESDARAFGALYERLASQARVSFKSKAGEAKQRVRLRRPPSPPEEGSTHTLVHCPRCQLALVSRGQREKIV